MAYKFITGSAQASGSFKADGPISASGEIAGKELKIGNQTVITDGKVLQNVTFSPDSLSGAVALNIFNESLFTSPNSAIKASGSITGSNIVATIDVSGAGEIVGQKLEAATTISGAGEISGQDLKLGNSVVISATKQVQNVISISGAGEVAGASLKVNNTTIATQAGALVAPTTVSGAGEIAGQSLKIGNSVVITDGKVLQNVTFSPSSLSGAVAINVNPEAIFQNVNSAIKASGSISASVDLSASGKVVGGSLITTNFKVTSAGLPSGSLIGDFIVDGFKASGSVQLGSDGQDNVKISGFPNFETGIQYSNMKPTGTINGAQVGVVGESDFFIHCSGGGIITLELAAAANLHEQSGTVLYIKRAASGAFGPMDHNVKIKAGTGTTIEGGNAHIMLETAGASVMLVASGSQGNTAVDTDWQVF